MEVNRKNKLLIGLVTVALVLLGKLFYIQCINGSYKVNADNNSMVYETIYPTRGIIYDRNGELLVGNKTAYDIIVTPREVKAFDTLALAAALDVDVQFIRDRMAYYRKYRSSIGYQSQTMIKQIPPQTYMRFAEIQYKFPGFKGQLRSIRDYPVDAGGNLLGYVSEVGVEEVVVLKADGQHLVHAAGVCGDMAVGPYQEGVVSFHGQIDLVVHVVLVKEVGHFYALFHRRSRHQDALGADFVPEFLTGGQGAQTREEDIEGKLLFHTTRHI